MAFGPGTWSPDYRGTPRLVYICECGFKTSNAENFATDHNGREYCPDCGCDSSEIGYDFVPKTSREDGRNGLIDT